jgi:hypothetical protein
MAAITNKLTCKQCGYVNEGERVYCHNCGSKLDRSLLPEDKKSKESLEKKQKRIRKAVMPSRGFFAGFGKMLITTLLWSATTASVVEIARPPDGVPPMLKKEDLLDAPLISNQLEDATLSTKQTMLTLKETDINGYLQNSIRQQSTGLIGDELKFVRVFVTLNEGEIRITTQQSIFDYSIYGSAYYNIAIKDKKIQATNVGGNFGRLMIHPQIMMYADMVFKKLWDALSRERKLLEHFQSFEIHKDHIDLVSKPGQ